MASSLIIEAALVNPHDKKNWLNQRVPNELLNVEWVQIRNLGINEASLRGIKLMHWEYAGKSDDSAQNVEVVTLSGILSGGTSLRIHSGAGNPYVDPKTRVVHIYINSPGSMFKYQIIRPDCLTLAIGRKSIDHARYNPPVPEGKWLKRGSNLSLHRLAVL